MIDGPGGPVAFLAGILSPSQPERGYVHLGFSVTGPVPGHNGPGRDLVVFERVL